MPYRFIFFTWLLTIPLNLVCIILTLILTGSPGFSSLNNLLESFDWEMVLLIAVFSVPFSIPGLFGLLILAWIANEFLQEPRPQFNFICFGCGVLTLGCYGLLHLTLNVHRSISGYLPLIIASLIAVFLALLITRKLYYKHINEIYERHLV